MDWIKAMGRSIDYIEDHLTKHLTIKDIAESAYASPYYYQRMFTVLTNMSVQTYIRNRRLTLAAMELQASNIKIIDLAQKYQYESAEAFSRAFKKMHGKTPTSLRKEHSPIQAFLKLTISVNLKGVEPMNYRIETKPAFSFYGMVRKFSTINDSNYKDIPKFWEETAKDGSCRNMLDASDSNQCLGVCLPMEPDNDTSFDYAIGAFTNETVKGYENYDVPEHEWAIFEVIGPVPSALQDVWKRIFSEWFPQSDFKHANLPEFEVYMEGNPNDKDYYMEIWIPVTK